MFAAGDDGPDMGGYLFHRREPDIAPAKDAFQKLGHNLPTRQVAKGCKTGTHNPPGWYPASNSRTNGSQHVRGARIGIK